MIIFRMFMLIYSPAAGLSNIYQARKRVTHQDIQILRSGLKKRGAADFFFFYRLRAVWIPDATLFRRVMGSNPVQT